MRNHLPLGTHESGNSAKRLSVYTFCPINCIGSSARDFEVSLYDDDTLLWYDVMSRAQTIDPREAVLEAIFADDVPDMALDDSPYVVKTRSRVGVTTMMARIAVIQRAKKRLSARAVRPLDVHLDEIFWAEVNSKLPQPLSRRNMGSEGASSKQDVA